MIGVCIKYFHENYGGMLQAYATITMLEKRNIKYELIRYEKHYSFLGKIKQIPRLFNGILLNDKKEALLKKIGMRKHPEFSKKDLIRMKAFDRFKKEKFINLSPVFIGYDNLCSGAKRYAAVITGSDQLWSPAGLPTNFYNLMFVPDNIRKISIASSFGVKYIPWYQISRTRNYLNRIEFISMRENRGSEIVKELTGRDVPTILDPVFFFNKEQWAEMIPTRTVYEEPYIFAYFLGNTPSYREAVKNVARRLNCKIVTLRHLDQYVECDENFGDYSPYDVDPALFLNILRGASYICTDSFHGSVFSIIHQKKFVIFNRYDEQSKHSKNSRIDTLCFNLGLTDRRFLSAESFYEQLNSDIDYKSVMRLLDKYKRESEQYLDTAFNNIN